MDRPVDVVAAVQRGQEKPIGPPSPRKRVSKYAFDTAGVMDLLSACSAFVDQGLQIT